MCLQYAQKMQQYKKSNPNFWANEVAFYLYRVSFVYKTNPVTTAMAPKARVWRRKSEGLQVTSKGSKDLAGEKRLHLMVAVAYGQGIEFPTRQNRPRPRANSRSIPACPREDLFVSNCSDCPQESLTNQNPLTVHIFYSLREC